jgi:amidase
MTRRRLLQIAACGALAAGAQIQGAEPAATVAKVREPFPWDETTLADLQAAMASGKASALTITRQYLARIAAIDKDTVNAVIEINPNAESIAADLDRQRTDKKLRGPLHGIPVLIKDNIDTHDRMRTSAGSLALADSIAPRDSFVAQRLRDAGAVILGKTNLTEWANFRGSRPTSGWSARGGLTVNPYVLDRNASGSSSGSAAAVSANLCAVAVGTETDGSIVTPSALCGVVGIKPTVGLVSRSGIIPISKSQDTAGPIARTVTDAAALLGALAGADPRDDATTQDPRAHAHTAYSQFLDNDALRKVRDMRVGVVRRWFSPAKLSAPVLEAALKTLQGQGVTLVDPVKLPSFDKLGDAEYEVLLYEFKAGLNAYLATLGQGIPVRSLEELIAWNEQHRDREMPYYQQETFIEAQKKGPLTEKEYLDALAKCRRLLRDEGIDAVMNEQKLDALVVPSGGPAGTIDLLYGDRDTGGASSPAAVAGYPNITVPAGHVHGLPVGLSFIGRAWSEPTLIQLAYAFEQATKHRKPPTFLPTLK